MGWEYPQRFQKTCTLNNPEIFCAIEQAGALGISTAKDIGKMFALMLSGELISRESLERLREPQIVNQMDYVLKVPVSKGHGFMYERHPRKPVGNQGNQRGFKKDKLGFRGAKWTPKGNIPHRESGCSDTRDLEEAR